MSLVLTSFFMAWGMFWIVPCPRRRWDEAGRAGMLLFLPLFGAFIGALWALLVWLRERFAPGSFGAALLALFPILMTGGIHLDGYMDCADAVLSRRDREKRLSILKDSHVGSFAVTALAALLLLSFSLFLGRSFGEKLLCLPFVCAAPRAYAAVAVLNFRPLAGSSYESMHGSSVSSSARTGAALILGGLIALPLLLFGFQGICSAVGVLGTAATVAAVRRSLGGMSGDVSGAGITVGELCALATLAIL